MTHSSSIGGGPKVAWPSAAQKAQARQEVTETQVEAPKPQDVSGAKKEQVPAQPQNSQFDAQAKSTSLKITPDAKMQVKGQPPPVKARGAGEDTSTQLWSSKRPTSEQPRQGGVEQLSTPKEGLAFFKMRKPQVWYNQTVAAVLDKDATLSEKFKFRGVCFILSHQWLECRSMGMDDAKSIARIKDGNTFHQLWGDFVTQGNHGSEIYSALSQELLRVVSTKSQLRQQISQATPEQQPELTARLQNAEVADQRLSAQLARMFAGDEERRTLGGGSGTSSEEMMRKMFEMNAQSIKRVNFEPKHPAATDTSNALQRLFRSNPLDRPAKCLELSNEARTKPTPALFEIGLYNPKPGGSAHSIALHLGDDGSYSLFDPNIGVFQGDGKTHSFDKDLAQLMESYYPKMTEVLLTHLTVEKQARESY
ncbi:C58 family peptidase [Myxococcus stipitatus]|uniref:YopT-type cysteine protease domain-containing protein n=1 Tax=Myxococcus stipitatus TaxID=83455 RepID=UPI003144F02A